MSPSGQLQLHFSPPPMLQKVREGNSAQRYAFTRADVLSQTTQTWQQAPKITTLTSSCCRWLVCEPSRSLTDYSCLEDVNFALEVARIVPQNL
jgi:hypothetical protein